MAKGRKKSLFGRTIGRGVGKVKTAIHRRKTKNEGVTEMRARMTKSRTKAVAKGKRRAAIRGAVSRATGLKVSTIGRGTSASNLGRRAAYKFTSARKSALQKAQRASARVRAMRSKNTSGPASRGGKQAAMRKRRFSGR